MTAVTWNWAREACSRLCCGRTWCSGGEGGTADEGWALEASSALPDACHAGLPPLLQQDKRLRRTPKVLPGNDAELLLKVGVTGVIVVFGVG